MKHAHECAAIWDYSSINIDFWRSECPHTTVTFVPVGYSQSFEHPPPSSLTTPPHPPSSSSPAFIGNMSPRRHDILSQLDPRVTTYTCVYGTHRDDVIRQHNLFVNIHYYPERPHILETVRLIPLVSQKKIIITESSDDPVLDSMCQDIVFFQEMTTRTRLSTTRAFPSEAFEKFRNDHPWSKYINRALESTAHSRIVLATLHCNDRSAIFDVIRSFAEHTSHRRFTWIILSQGCSQEHNDLLRKELETFSFHHDVLCLDENMGWSRGMNILYDHLETRYSPDYVLHLEDDWLCETSNMYWFNDCVSYLDTHPDVSTLFLRKYKSEKEKWDYGWTRSIWYMCFQHPHPFEYATKMKDHPIVTYKRLQLRRIPEFLYSANPTLFRFGDYKKCGVFPFEQYNDLSQKRQEWKTTTSEDAPQWGYAEAVSMEKIRDLVCMNVDKGIFFHRF
jgi:hypothetical protein